MMISDPYGGVHAYPDPSRQEEAAMERADTELETLNGKRLHSLGDIDVACLLEGAFPGLEFTDSPSGWEDMTEHEVKLWDHLGEVLSAFGHEYLDRDLIAGQVRDGKR